MSRYYRDIETGELVEISEECWNTMQSFNIMKQKHKEVGKIFIFGTGGDSNVDNLEKLFYSPSNYKIKKWDL